MKILFATSELHPLIKTGGLADVSGSLPRALKNLRHDVRVVLPAYREVLERAGRTRQVAVMDLPGETNPARVLETRIPDSTVKLYLVDAPQYFDRPGGPYAGPDGDDWPDNAQRYAAFARVAVRIALDRSGLDWRPDLVHCNDWQTGLIPALLADQPERPPTVFTVHNLAYQGLTDRRTFEQLGLPHHWWSLHALEFHGRISFIKGGLVFADWITTVSPTYAKEICTAEYGCGLEGILQHRRHRLSGILNGVDYKVWSPAKDKLITHSYSARGIGAKADNKKVLQQRFQLRPLNVPLFAHVGRLVQQKGIDLLLDALPALNRRDVQIVLVGTGQKNLESALRKARKKYPAMLGVHIGYDERLAHWLEAGADVFMMPSRFEPCGLNQLYSLRYGTPPLVRRTGGLADSVVDTTDATLAEGSATGFLFDRPDANSLMAAVDRAIDRYREPRLWRRIMRNGMRQDFSWKHSAKEYLALYEQLIAAHASV